jgi:PAS domain S-box-containing protein
MRQHPDVALVLLDVVMEEDDSGLKVARFIREELCNHFVRIVLRTGQPGQAPEEDVIVGYDINDYKEKTELTSKKLFTLMYSGLRAYRDIIELERNRSYVHTLLDATGLVLGAVSEDGRILNITASIEKLTNYRPDELHERQIWDLMALPEEAEEMKAALESPHQPAVGLHSKLFTGHLNMKAGGWRLVKWTNTALSLNGEAGFAILFVSAPSNSLAEEEPQP